MGASVVISGTWYYHAYIRIPELMRRSQSLRFCLHSGPLSGRERQIINLVVARDWGAKFPWFAQARGALAVGLEQEVIDAINANEAPELDDPREQAVYKVARELLTERSLSDATFASAEASLGSKT